MFQIAVMFMLSDAADGNNGQHIPFKWKNTGYYRLPDINVLTYKGSIDMSTRDGRKSNKSTHINVYKKKIFLSSFPNQDKTLLFKRWLWYVGRQGTT